MPDGTTVTIIPCGAMTADITWLLLAPGRAMRTRQNKQAPAEWADVPTHCVLVDTPDGRLLWDTSCPRDWEQRWEPTGLQDFFPYDKVSEEEYLDSRLKQLGLGPAGLQRQGEGVRARVRRAVHRRAPQGRLPGPGLRDGVR
jgi:hypothetical protein